MDRRLFKRENSNNEDLTERKILIVDDQSFNLDAALIIMNTSMRLNTEKLCSLAYNCREAFNKVIQSVHEFRQLGER